MPRSQLASALYALAATVVLLASAAWTASAQAGVSSGPPQAEDWRLETRLLPEQGYRLTTTGTVDGQLARVERSLALDTGELTIAYHLGSESDPQRTVEAHLTPTAVYTFRDTNGDGRFDLSDEVVEHRRVVAPAGAYVTPVNANTPFEAARAVLPLEDGGRVDVTLTASPTLASLRGEQLAPTASRLNLTVAGLTTPEDAYTALATTVDAPRLATTDDGLLRLDGEGAGVEYRWLGPMLERNLPGPSKATVLEDRLRGEGEDAAGTVLLASPSSSPSRHEAELGVVHTSSGLAEVAGAIRGDPGTFLAAMLGSAVLVGAAAWRKMS